MPLRMKNKGVDMSARMENPVNVTREAPVKSSRTNSVRFAFKRLQKRFIVAWVRFARKHRESNILPVGLFIILFIDGFVVMFPSMIITGAAVTISPHRWWLFALIFVTAYTVTNVLIYQLGMILPAEFILHAIEVLNLQTVYESAEHALLDYGPWAAFLGAAISLPVQMITLMVGMTDGQAVLAGREISASATKLITLAGLGHLVKMVVYCSIIRYGWQKLEAKVLQEIQLFGSRKNGK